MSDGLLKRTPQFEQGLAVRREVLGAAYVEKSVANAKDDEFLAPLQQLITEWCWGAVWTRPGLSRRDRSIANLAMITALNRPAELALHVRGALNNGLSRAEIMEVLLQTAVYCGVPAALESFKVARQVLREIDEQSATQPAGSR